MRLFFLPILFTIFLFSCGETATKDPVEVENTSNADKATSEFEHIDKNPSWSKNATIYEVNLRQFTPEGTITAFQKHLPRLKDLGVDIIWFMPINPISLAKRKGELGSYYSVADYRGFNAEHGTMDEFKATLKEAHDLGMKVIIDWVPNHTGWDHAWITDHPEYYTQDKDGNIIDPIDPETGESWGWTDVADLNYDNQAMRNAMIADMAYWITDIGIDGFRMDVAHNVPEDFWKKCNNHLKSLGDVFLLAEAEIPALRNECGFEATYAWNFKNIVNELGEGKANAEDVWEYLEEDEKLYQKGFHMYFTTNHDENTWDGTVFDRLGEGHKAIYLLCGTMAGMPLVYSGQESANKKRLEFFKKDPIKWGDYSLSSFYAPIMKLHQRNQAMFAGAAGGKAEKVETNKSKEVFCFTRSRGKDKVFVAINLSDKPVEFTLASEALGNFKDIFSDKEVELSENKTMNLEPWGYVVLEK